MSRAFVKESDDAPEPPLGPRPSATLPPGAVNYLTAAGEHRLRAELDRLVTTARPRLAAAAADQPEAKRQLHELDERIQHLRQSLHSAVVVPPPAGPADHVHFGATVTVRDRDGETRYRIVGVDETDPERGWISWCSPMAKTLLNAQVGQRLQLQRPGAPDTELTILRIEYE
jgi:transcription elongation factor GreB